MKEENVPVYQNNSILIARKHYGILEHRLLRLAIADLKPHLKNAAYYDKEIRPFHMDAPEVIELFGGTTNKRIYEQLRAACKQMFDSKIEMGNEKDFKLVHLFEEISFDSEKGLDIYFSKRVKNLLLEMEHGNYTRTILGLSFSLSSRYSLILLELMLQFQGKKKNGVIERDLSIEELRFSLDVPEDAYKGRMSNFRRFVIDASISEINNKTDYYIEPDYGLKRGRFNKITGFHFVLHLPKKNEIMSDTENHSEGQPALEEPQPKEKELEDLGQTKLFAENELLISKLAKYGILTDRAEEMISVYGSERVEANLKYALNNKHNKKSMSGWIISCVEQDHAAAAEEADSLRKKAAEKEKAELLARVEPMPEVPELPADSPFRRYLKKGRGARKLTKSQECHED